MGKKMPNLNGRKAKCVYCDNVKPSSFDLPFFQYRGPDSENANKHCKNCGYHKIAHNPEIKGNNKFICDNFEPKGSWEYDVFNCLCKGTD